MDFLRLRFGAKNQSSGSPRSVRALTATCKELLSERGEVSGAHLAEEALGAYRSLPAAERDAFFDVLIREFSPDPAEVGAAAEAYRGDPSPANYARLRRAVEAPRQELFRRLNLAAGATAQLVEMRRYLLDSLAGRPQWAPVEADLAHLLYSWFNRGFLVLQRIDWRTPAIVLEKLIHYEAVHQIRGWLDLRRRLEADRRCYAFFHPALPDEPIIFIEVALTRGMSARIQPLLEPESPVLDPKSANCAMFYSITNCQAGLRGVPFGSFLIKRVAEDLGKEFPRIRTFASISPVPGFRSWLDEEMAAGADHPRSAALLALLAALKKPEALREAAPEVRGELISLCARYLLNAKRGNEPADPVARFHLRNGARLERINWLADTSPGGLQSSAGIMVNYVYRLADVERNHEQYTKEFRIAASSEILKLARRPAPQRERLAR
jgi:malonyl-CoA decarboxylase